LGSVTGASVGGVLNRAIYQKSPALSDAFISAVYVLMLGILGIYAFADWVRMSRSTGTQKSSTEATTRFAKWLQSLPLKPRVKFDEHIVAGGRSIAVYPVIICGFIVGFVAAIMGVGGGFLTFPMFVYGLGVSTFTTVGTDILQIIFTTGYSSIAQYAIYGYVFYSVAMGMLLGSLVGVQIGALVTKMVKGVTIRAFYALTILAGFVNRICALPGKLNEVGWISLNKSTAAMINSVGTVIFFTLVGIFSLWILAVFLKGAGRIREAERQTLTAGSAGAGH
ncbi:MAG: sulfite exporter TauE/SafE family protein, partial [Desulfofundulus sp.]